MIHMNGRIYDAVIGRFLQVDPIIQAPGNAQSHNRYSYVLNNPLSFTDPSGFSAWTKFRDTWLRPVLAIAVGIFLGPAGYFGAWLGGNSFLTAVAAGFASGGISGGNIQSALQGALSAGLFFGAGTIADGIKGAGVGGFGEGGLGRAALHAAAGCASSAAAGGSCQSGAISAGFAEAIGGTLGKHIGGGVTGQAAFRSVIGGIASKLGGGKFENGAMSGAFGYLFNYLAHALPKTTTTSGTTEVTFAFKVSFAAGGGAYGSNYVGAAWNTMDDWISYVPGEAAGKVGGIADKIKFIEKIAPQGYGTESLDGFSAQAAAYKMDKQLATIYKDMGYADDQLLSPAEFRQFLVVAVHQVTGFKSTYAPNAPAVPLPGSPASMDVIITKTIEAYWNSPQVQAACKAGVPGCP
jgi:hypothetical protein